MLDGILKLNIVLRTYQKSNPYFFFLNTRDEDKKPFLAPPIQILVSSQLL